MKKTISILFFLSSTAHAKPVNTGWFNSTAVNGYDTVAYFAEKKAVKGSSDFTYRWNNAKWKFSSHENLEKFKTDPGKYAPQYGGYCAYAMAEGKKAEIDPEAFDIQEGKLYLNYNRSIQKKWKAKVSTYIEDADTQWGDIE